VTGDWRRLNYEELYDLYTYNSGDKIKNEMGGACSKYVGEEKCVEDFGGRT
jgi:hypothetical protein